MGWRGGEGENMSKEAEEAVSIRATELLGVNAGSSGYAGGKSLESQRL